MLGIIFLIFSKNNIFRIIGILFLIAPSVSYKISQKNIEKNTLKNDDVKKLEKIAYHTWNFFESNLNEKNNFLICDNYQEDRIPKTVNRTSSTNIGLEIISIISAYDMNFIDFDKCKFYLEALLNTIKRLSKWNGHLYNWYNTLSLEPLKPMYVSTVDSGNFVGYMYILKAFLEEHIDDNECNLMHDYIVKLIEDTDFSKLYSDSIKLLSVGFNLEDNKLTDSYYDFLASEARQASLVAIAKRDIPLKHWNALSRTITIYKGYKGLISWTGTAFEYLMPNINLARYEGSLIDESSKFAIMSQKEYCKRLNVPWGISESAYNLKDLNSNYQYKAFGIPWLGLKRGLEYDLVISPYSTFLALQEGDNEAMDNIYELEKLGSFGKYGFYEAIDFTSSRLRHGEKYAVVKTYMAHHQGLIFNSINNVLNNNILQKRFNNNPEIEAVQILLQERMPKEFIITGEKKIKPERQKNFVDSGYIEEVILMPQKMNRKYNVISNENYKIVIDDLGEGFSSYKNLLINKYNSLSELKQGILWYIKNLKTNKMISRDNLKTIFAKNKAEFYYQDGGLKVKEIVHLDSNAPVEIRRIELENLGSSEEILDVANMFIPVISNFASENAHPAFNSMFLKFEKQEDILVVERHSRDLEKRIYLAVCLSTENDQIVDSGTEINAEKIYDRNILNVPSGIILSKNFSNDLGYSINKIIAMKKVIRLNTNSKATFNFVISISENKEEAIKNLKEHRSENEIVKDFEISKIKCEEEMKYLQIDSNLARTYQSLQNLIVEPNYVKNIKLDLSAKFIINSLWKFGISGDIPIFLVKIKNSDNFESLEKIIDAYLYYRIKGVYIDLVILNEEDNVYEKYVQNGINQILLDKQVEYLKNINTGIFIINIKDMLEEELETLRLKAKLEIDLSKENLEKYINLRKDKKYRTTKFNIVTEEENIPRRNEELLFFNGFGGFSLDGREYKFAINKDRKVQAVWSNVISNKSFGVVTTENMYDVVWNKNSRLNRLLAWNNNTVQNIPSQIVYIRDLENDKIWTLNSNVTPNSNYYYITHGFGYSKYSNSYDGILQESDVFVPNNSNASITKIRFKNTTNVQKNLKIVVYFKTVLGEDEITTLGNCYMEKKGNIIYMKNLLSSEEFNKLSYITSNLEIKDFTKSKKIFIGNGSINYPDYLTCKISDSKEGIGDCATIEFEITLKEFEEEYLTLIIGQENSEKEILSESQKLTDIKNIDNELQEVNRKWFNINNIITVQTPDDALNIMMNGWLVYQTESCRIYGKTAFYQSGGAYGFRDQLQDCMGIKLIDEELLKEQIEKCCMHQFIEGDVLHWWHEENKRGIRTKFSDDLLWLPYAVMEYIDFTADYAFLNEEMEYLNGNKLKEDEQEVYNQFFQSDFKESIYKHCIRAIDYSLKFGANGFPLIGCGDWNDGFSNIGTKGKGESVWLGFFLYDILNRFIPICEKQNDKENALKYEEVKENLRYNLNTKGWDGRWFKRAITDDGVEIGSMSCDECKIDGISQSWAVISDAADNDKKYISMQEVENNLIDKENKIIKLFWPAFENMNINPRLY